MRLSQQIQEFRDAYYEAEVWERIQKWPNGEVSELFDSEEISRLSEARIRLWEASESIAAALGGSGRPLQPGYWPGTAETERLGPVGDGTPAARMEWTWQMVHKRLGVVERMVPSYSPVVNRRPEDAFLEAFDTMLVLLEESELTERTLAEKLQNPPEHLLRASRRGDERASGILEGRTEALEELRVEQTQRSKRIEERMGRPDPRDQVPLAEQARRIATLPTVTQLAEMCRVPIREIRAAADELGVERVERGGTEERVEIFDMLQIAAEVGNVHPQQVAGAWVERVEREQPAQSEWVRGEVDRFLRQTRG